jgi:hypothetical protein
MPRRDLATDLGTLLHHSVRRPARERRPLSYSPRISKETEENILAKQLGSPHSQDTLDGWSG